MSEDTPEKADEISEKKQEQVILYADFETFTKEENGNSIIHDPFLLCYTENGAKIYNGRTIFSLIDYLDTRMEPFLKKN